MTARWRGAASGVLVAGVLALSGCSAVSGGLYETPLPGGADVGDDPITVTAEFRDVLDLVPQSSVKVDDVPVGRVTDISLGPDGRTARVEMLVRGDLGLPGDTTARLQQTSLLGEKYVALVRPSESTARATSVLADDAVLGTADTDAAATAEQVLGALSLVLNGGGVAQFQEISRELQAVGGGREGEIKNFLEQVDRFVTTLDSRRGAITGALDSLARLSATLDGDRDQVAAVLKGLSPGLQVLAEQRPQLTRMLTALDRLSRVTVSTLDASQDDIVADLEALAPILDQLARSGSDLPRSLEVLLTYPFPDSVLGAIDGDYLNVFVTTNFRTRPPGCTSAACPWPQPVSTPDGGPDRGSRAGGSDAPGPPTLLPPTSNAGPGTDEPAVAGPPIATPDGGATPPDTAPSPAPVAPSASGPPTTTPTPTPTAGPTAGPTATRRR